MIIGSNDKREGAKGRTEGGKRHGQGMKLPAAK